MSFMHVCLPAYIWFSRTITPPTEEFYLQASSASFHPLTNRKHHCRLCGDIICSLPPKPPLRPAPCSVLFVVDAKTRRIEEVGEGVDYGVRRAGAGEEEKFLRGVRVCRSCRPILTRQQYWQELVSVPPFVRFYDVSCCLNCYTCLCGIHEGIGVH
jgi:hypothetical protein